MISQLSPTKHGFILKREEFLEGMTLFLYWSIPSFFFALLQKIEGHNFPSLYIKSAVEEGIGPHIWNIFGSIGLVFFGLTIIAPKFKFFRISASQILLNTYAMGALSIGLMIGNLLIIFESSRFDLWNEILLKISFFLSFTTIIIINFAIWYCSKIIGKEEQNDSLIDLFAKVDTKIRLPLGLSIATLPIVFFYFFEK
ncbi:hypothetical protein O0882_11075 [Janthinobacterium sp. SUN073]|uniref:hypothetical protein n=1 Tax=Janthinobacterium sp. SUN073 TaxID=3004102 RepID=UPI0025AFC4FF|nr:hypothetical protein [Janthinobacterium sp. SUN073]MDN2696863.1 hypothetical protein [Janthinobacterium sp. SUN073]